MATTDPDGLQYARGALKNYDILMKSLLVGDSGVGKSCFMARFVGEHVNNTHIATIGIDFKLHTIAVEGVRVRIQIWDTAGQERFNSLTNQYYRRVNGIFLVYDITNAASFNNVRRWMDHISQKANRDVRILLVGNKYDLACMRAVSRREGEGLAKQYGVPYMETSAMEGFNVQEADIGAGRRESLSRYDDDMHVSRGVPVVLDGDAEEGQAEEASTCAC